MTPLPLILMLATLVTTGRVFLAIALSIVTGWALGYLSLKSRVFENAYVSLSEVLESVPVISFFPVVLIFFIWYVRGYIGVELAVDFLVFTAVTWNIWMGIYQAFKTVPASMLEVVENLGYGFFKKMARLYIPYSMPRIAANLLPSFADGYFYITVSEVIAIGTTTYKVFGIGALLSELISKASSNPVLWPDVYVGLTELAAVVALVVLGLRRFANWTVAKYSLESAVALSRRKSGPGRWRTLSRYYRPVVRPMESLAGLGSRALVRMATTIPLRRVETRRHRSVAADNVIKAVGAALLVLIAYGAIRAILSASPSTWGYLISETPTILIGLAYDYARVAFITLISFVIAVFVGYWLAMHRRAEAIVIPVIQALSALPAPAYFPLLFAATYFIVGRFFAGLTNEFYVIILGFISTFYYVFYAYWLGVKAVPVEVMELMDNLRMGFFRRLRKILIPGTMPYLVSGLTSTIDSAWGGLMVGEYWPNIYGNTNLYVSHGLMKMLDMATLEGNLALASWASLIFAMFVVVFALGFTRYLMELSRKKYLMEESIYAV